MSLSQGKLLCEQVRHNISRLREYVYWARLELMLLTCGVFGGTKPVKSLEDIGKEMERVLQCVRGMRQSLICMDRTQGQKSFSVVLHKDLYLTSRAVSRALQEVSDGVDVYRLIARSCPKGLIKHIFNHIADEKNPTLISTKSMDEGVMSHKQSRESNPLSLSLTLRSERGSDRGYGRAEGWGEGEEEQEQGEEEGRSTRPSLLSLMPQPQLLLSASSLEEVESSVRSLMGAFQRARRRVLYGLDDEGRPLEEGGGGQGLELGFRGGGNKKKGEEDQHAWRDGLESSSEPPSETTRRPVPCARLPALPMRPLSQSYHHHSDPGFDLSSSASSAGGEREIRGKAHQRDTDTEARVGVRGSLTHVAH
ncbi:unnamed protein product, partial [Discosporangium mesarthrocarpum]